VQKALSPTPVKIERAVERDFVDELEVSAEVRAERVVNVFPKVGGEVESSILQGHANKQHDGYLGHAYVGAWTNLGALTTNSDLKNNYSTVRVWTPEGTVDTGEKFVGVFLGDHAKTAIGTLLNTGTVVGFNCNVFSSEMPAKFVPSFSWGHGSSMTRYELDKAMQTASVVMERRQVRFTPAHRAVFEKIFQLRERTSGNI